MFSGIVFFSCTKKESTPNYTCSCTIIQSICGVPQDTVTQSCTVNSTSAGAQAALTNLFPRHLAVSRKPVLVHIIDIMLIFNKKGVFRGALLIETILE